jgi:hypothetical protein
MCGVASTDETTTDKGRRLEDEVAQIYRSLGYRVDQNLRLGGKQIDILVSKDQVGVPPTRLLVECKNWADRSVSNEDLYKFWATLKFLIDEGHVGGGVIVCARGYSENAKGVLQGKANVALLTVEDLRRSLLDLADAQEVAIQRYESSEVFAHYLSLDARFAKWTPAGIEADTEAPTDAEVHLLKRLDSKDDFAVLVLADYGSGKTTLLERIRYRVQQRREADRSVPLPVIIELKGYYALPDVFELIRSALRQSYLLDIPAPTLRDQIDSGGILLLFDGFDEMVDRSDVGRRAQLLSELLPYLDSRCPAILTSRPTYFVEPDELVEFGRRIARWSEPLTVGGEPVRKRKLKERAQALNDLKKVVELRNRDLLAQGPGTRQIEETRFPLIYLEPLDEEKITRYVFAHSRELEREVGLTPERVLDFIQTTYDLRDLAERPMLLKLIMDTVFGGALELDNPKITYGPSSLYEIYTAMKLQIDTSKGAVRGAVRGETRRALSQMIALSMHRQGVLDTSVGKVTVELHDLSRALANEFPELADLTLEEIVTDFMTSSFLHVHQNGNCAFVHKSFREFFVARSMKDLTDVRTELLETDLPREVLYFLGGFAPTEPRVRTLLWEEYVNSEPAAAVRRRNLILALLFSQPAQGPRTVKDLQLWDAGYREIDLNQWRISDLELVRFRFEVLRLNNTRSTGLIFTESSLNQLAVRHGKNDLHMEATSISAVSAADATVVFSAATSDIGSISIAKSSAEIHVSSSAVGGLSCNTSVLNLHLGDGARLGDVEIDDTVVSLDFHPRALVSGLAFRASVVDVASLGRLGRANLTDCLIDARSQGGSSDKAPVTASFTRCLALVDRSFDTSRLPTKATGLVLIGASLDATTSKGRACPGIYLMEETDADKTLGGGVDIGVVESGAVVCRSRWWVRGGKDEGHIAYQLQQRTELLIKGRAASAVDIGELLDLFDALVSTLAKDVAVEGDQPPQN